MSSPFFELELKEKIEFVSLSPYECSQNLICLAFKNKIVVGIIKFQEEFDDIDHEVEFEQIEEFYHGPRVHAISWNPNTSLNKLPKTVEICTAGSDFSLRIFMSDISSRRHVRKELEGHVDYINDCAYDPEGDFLASVSDDLTCKLWQANQEFKLDNTFNLTSPGMCVAWHQDEPGKLLVGEKKGVIRLYNTLMLQPLRCIMCGLVPLTSISWSPQSKLLAILANGELLVTDINLSTHAKDSKMLHPGGGYKIAFCNINDNYVATAGRPGTTLKITHVKNKQSIVSANIEMFGGFSWHHRLPYLCVGNNSKLSIFKISPK